MSLYSHSAKESSGDGHIVRLTVGNVSVGRRVTVMIQKQMEFDGSFRSAEISPREKSQAKSDGRSIQGKQFVLEPKFMVLGSCHLAHVHRLIE